MLALLISLLDPNSCALTPAEAHRPPTTVTLSHRLHTSRHGQET